MNDINENENLLEVPLELLIYEDNLKKYPPVFKDKNKVDWIDRLTVALKLEKNNNPSSEYIKILPDSLYYLPFFGINQI